MMKGTMPGVELDAVWLGDGCVLTSKNIKHPLIQEFLKDGNPTDANGNLIAFQVYKTNSRGETLSQFLLRHGVDLLKNPNALDVAAAKPVTPMFAKKGEEAAAEAKEAKQQQTAPTFSGLDQGLKSAFGNKNKGLFN